MCAASVTAQFDLLYHSIRSRCRKTISSDQVTKMVAACQHINAGDGRRELNPRNSQLLTQLFKCKTILSLQHDYDKIIMLKWGMLQITLLFTLSARS